MKGRARHARIPGSNPGGPTFHLFSPLSSAASDAGQEGSGGGRRSWAAASVLPFVLQCPGRGTASGEKRAAVARATAPFGAVAAEIDEAEAGEEVELAAPLELLVVATCEVVLLVDGEV